ncbi:MAG: MGMT family protein [Patescibacteria group bacterium]
MSKKSTNFYQAVYKLVKKIPAGKVATYGQAASLLGKSRAARLVSWALANCSINVPWQRVVNRDDMISIENLHLPKELQVELLKQEKIEITRERHN